MRLTAALSIAASIAVRCAPDADDTTMSDRTTTTAPLPTNTPLTGR